MITKGKRFFASRKTGSSVPEYLQPAAEFCQALKSGKKPQTTKRLARMKMFTLSMPSHRGENGGQLMMPNISIRQSRAAKAALAITMLLSCFGAHAQVNKCVDAAGKVSYSEQPCAATQRGGQVLGRGATEPVHDPYAAQRTLDSYRRASAIQRSMADTAMQQSQGPAGAATMSRQAPPQAGREASQDLEGCETLSNRKGCIGGERGRNPNWSPKRGYYGGGGPADQRYAEEQRAAAARRPTSFHGCDRAGCWADNGARYNFGAGGNLHGANGTVCLRGAGNTFQCN